MELTYTGFMSKFEQVRYIIKSLKDEVSFYIQY
jgi:hypothetical protein